MPTACIEEGQAAAPFYTTGRARAHDTDTKRWTMTAHYWSPHLPLPHTRDPSCRAPLTRDHPQACEPRCADVFKHYLACADRIEQKGAGAGAASLNTNRQPSYAIAATAHQKKRAGDCEPYYFDWLKCIDKCAMPHIMQKLK